MGRSVEKGGRRDRELVAGLARHQRARRHLLLWVCPAASRSGCAVVSSQLR